MEVIRRRRRPGIGSSPHTAEPPVATGRRRSRPPRTAGNHGGPPGRTVRQRCDGRLDAPRRRDPALRGAPPGRRRDGPAAPAPRATGRRPAPGRAAVSSVVLRTMRAGPRGRGRGGSVRSRLGGAFRSRIPSERARAVDTSGVSTRDVLRPQGARFAAGIALAVAYFAGGAPHDRRPVLRQSRSADPAGRQARQHEQADTYAPLRLRRPRQPHQGRAVEGQRLQRPRSADEVGAQAPQPRQRRHVPRQQRGRR